MPLQNTDLFVVGRNDESYKITYQDLKDDLNYVPPPAGTIDTPQVLSPEDNAGSGDIRHLESDTITKVEDAGTDVYTTDTIASVAGNVLTFPTATNFDKFEVGDVVQDPNGWNQSEKWSDGATGGINRPGLGPTNAFDGDLTTFFNSEDSQSATFAFTGITINTLRLFCRGNNGSLAVTLGGTQQAITTDTNAAQWQSATVSGPVSFDSIDIADSSQGVYAIEVDGEILVDPSVSNPDAVSITDIDPAGPTITTDGGSWLGADNSGDPAGDTDISKTVAYGTKLTVATDKDLAYMSGTVFMTDGQTNPDGTFVPASYTLQTSEIASVTPSSNSLIPTDYSSQISVPGGFNGSEGYAFDGEDSSVARCNGCGNAWYDWNIPSPHYTVPDGGVITVHAFNPTSNSGSVNVYYLREDGTQGADKVTITGSDDGSTGDGSPFSTQPGELDGKIVWKISNRINATGSGGLSGYTMSGVYVLEGQPFPGSDTTLAFNTPNPDLQYFQVGDKVEGSETPATFAPTPAFSTTLYDGTGGAQDIDTGVDNSDKSLVWLKIRSPQADHHKLFDTLRGPNSQLSSNLTGAASSTTTQHFDFSSNGFKLLTDYAPVNGNGYNYVAWNFRAAPGFFDVVTWDGNSVTNTGIPHSLSSTPGCIIAKSTSAADDWFVYHKDSSVAWTGNETQGDITGGNNTGCMILNQTVSFEANKSVFTYVNDQKFGVQFGNQNLNANGSKYIAYLFADTPGTIKCGKYNGTGSSQTIDCGFKAGWVMIKTIDSDANWVIHDIPRNNFNEVLHPNINAAASDTVVIDTNDNGFRLNNFNNSSYNAAGQTYIYVAIAENATAAGSVPTGIVTEADVNGPTLTLSDTTGDWTSQVGLPVAGPTNTAEGTFLNADGTEVSLSASSGRWIADNKAGTAFSIAGPSIVDAPLLTADITLVSSQFATTPIDQDDLKNAKWTITKQGGSTEVLDAGAVYSYNPPNGTFDPNSTYTVSVQYQGLTLEDSEQSTSITFTTGATRTMYDRVLLLATRIAALEADHMTLMNNNNGGGY